MKTTLCTLAAVLVLAGGLALAGEEPAWLDLENCAMCKHLTADQELFDAMTWKTELFKNGLMDITIVPAKYDERFQKLMATMGETSQKLMAGEQLPLCGMCRSYGALMAAGADMAMMQSGEAHVSVISSRDPAVVEQIRAHGQKTIDEFAKWHAAEAAAGDKAKEHGAPKH